MEVSHAELRPWYVNREESAAAAGEVFDVAVSTMLGAARDRAGTFLTNFVFEVGGGGAGVDILGLGRLRDDAFKGGRVDKVCFALVPGVEDFGTRCAA